MTSRAKAHPRLFCEALTEIGPSEPGRHPSMTATDAFTDRYIDARLHGLSRADARADAEHERRRALRELERSSA